MKERFLNFIKWFFIILGILFLIQLLIMSGIFIGFNSIKETEIKPANANLKEIRPIINYVEDYREKNNKYPDSVDIKLKHGEYTYETGNNSNCYKIIYNNIKTKKEYGSCTINSENSNSKTETYSETTN